MNKIKQAQYYIDEIRKILTVNTQKPSQPTWDQQKMLINANSMVQKSKIRTKDETQLRILQASALLKKQTNHIKEYVKQKIQSKIFKEKKSINEDQKVELERQKKQIQNRLEEERRQEERVQAYLIQSARKFRKYQKVNNVPIIKIDSIMQNQIYLNKHVQEYSIKSNNNLIDLPQQSLYEFRQSVNQFEEQDQPQSEQNNINEQNRNMQYEDIELNQVDFKQINRQALNKEMNQQLLRHPQFLKVFKIFLEKHIRLTQKTHSTQYLIKQLSVKSKKSEEQETYKFNIKPNKQEIFVRERSLTKLVKEKKTKMIKIIEKQFEEDQVICEMLLSKQIGQSNKFHTKRCILMPNWLYYTDENDIEKKEMKKIELIPQQIELFQTIKQEGSVFNKKTQNIEVMVIKGKDRRLILELNALQGRQFKKEFQRLMAFKFYRMNCVLSHHVSQDLQNFINNQKYRNFCLNNLILGINEHPFKDLRQKTINNLISLIESRSKIEQISMVGCKLQQSQYIRIFKTFKNSQIKKITFRQIKINNLMMGNILLLCKISGSQQIDLQFSNCEINNEVIISNLLVLKQFAQKIIRLDISKNNIDQQCLTYLKDCFSISSIKLKSINFSHCPIKKLSAITQFLKQTPQLQYLIAEGCSLHLDEPEIKDLFKICDMNKIQNILLQKNQILFDIGILNRNWKGKYPLTIQVQVNRFTQKIARRLKASLVN